MKSSGDFDIQNFQSLLESYDSAIKDVTSELGLVKGEQTAIRGALKENDQLSVELHQVLAERANSELEHKYKKSDFVENLQLQLTGALEEKNHAVKLWQSATEHVEDLEEELRIYQENTEGLVPKAKLIQLRNSYEGKINELQSTVAETRRKLEDALNQKSKELHHKNLEINGALQSKDNTFKIVKNLEDEVLSLQERVSEANTEKHKLEKLLKIKTEECDGWREKAKDCKNKVAEALQVVEAAFSEKDAALLREAQLKDEIAKLSQSFSEFIDETETKVKKIKTDYDTKIECFKRALQVEQENCNVKNQEVETYRQRCSFLEEQVERLRQTQVGVGDEASQISKILSLERTLEDTFQKLLQSEKLNIRLKSELDSVKSDLGQMALHYERDVQNRDAERTLLRNEIATLKLNLEESHLKETQSTGALQELNSKISSMETNFKEQIKDTKTTFQQTCKEREEMETVHNQLVWELQDQLTSQTENNRKWRQETRTMTEQLEKVIEDVKSNNSRLKLENKSLGEKLKDANLKMLEYRKFLEMVSKDVTKITNIAEPGALFDK